MKKFHHLKKEHISVYEIPFHDFIFISNIVIKICDAKAKQYNNQITFHHFRSAFKLNFSDVYRKRKQKFYLNKLKAETKF